LPGEAITGPGTGRHGPFGRIDVLNSPNGLLGMFFFLTIFLREVWGYSALRTGMAYLPYVPPDLGDDGGRAAG
jgi:hypothetical protein